MNAQDEVLSQCRPQVGGEDNDLTPAAHGAFIDNKEIDDLTVPSLSALLLLLLCPAAELLSAADLLSSK